VVGPFSGLADGNGHLRQGRFPAVLAAMLGVTGEEWRPLAGSVGLEFAEPGPADRATAGTPGSLEASVWSEDLRLQNSSAVAVATFTSGCLAGQPAATRNSHGKGTAWYIGCDLPPAALGHIVGVAVTEAGLRVPVAAELPDDVELATRGGYHFLLNHSPELRPVRLTGESVDLLTGDSHGPDITLEPYGALVLKNSFDHTENGN
jgi:beta-galactosidase